MGYGMSYAAKDNPFYSSKGFAIGFGYIIEVLHYIPIFGGAFFGETRQDKIAIPIIGLSSLFFWKKVIYGNIFGKKTIEGYNNLAKMKYKIPNSIIE